MDFRDYVSTVGLYHHHTCILTFMPCYIFISCTYIFVPMIIVKASFLINLFSYFFSQNKCPSVYFKYYILISKILYKYLRFPSS